MIEKKCWLSGAIASVASQANKALIIRCVYIAERIYIYNIYEYVYNMNSRHIRTSTYFILHTCVWPKSKSVSRNKVNVPSVHIEKTDIYNIIFR